MDALGVELRSQRLRRLQQSRGWQQPIESANSVGYWGVGAYSGQIVLNPRSQNSQPFDGALWHRHSLAECLVVLPGDFNRDSLRTNADLQAMLEALKNPTAYKTANNFTDADLLVLGDLNSDAVFNAADIAPLMGLLTGTGGGSAAVPEPVSIALLALALPGLVLVVVRRRGYESVLCLEHCE